MRKTLVPAFFFAITFLAGFRIAIDSWDRSVFVYFGELRAPAATRSIRDYSAFDRRNLYASVHKQLVTPARLVKENGFMGVSLGHPLFKKSKGGGDFACPVNGRAGMFDRFELTFVGTGITSGGEAPRMVVESACTPGMSIGRIKTVWIPMDLIVNVEAKDQEIHLSGEHAISVHLQNIPGEWPENWVLSTVRFFRAGREQDSFIIDSKRLREARAISFDWKRTQ